MAKKKPTEVSNGVKYTVDGYCTILRAANRSEHTIQGYRKILKSYAEFLKVPLDEVHNHLSVSNLLKYADSRKTYVIDPSKPKFPKVIAKKKPKKKYVPKTKAAIRIGCSPAGIRSNLSILHRFFVLNGVQFDPLEFNAVQHKRVRESGTEKPLELSSLQKMMDLTDPHGKAIITFLISTGCRAGEVCQLLLSDVNGDVVTIRDEIAKGGHGGKVYLSSEAREYLDLWLADRTDYMRIADARTKPFVKKGTAPPRPVNDQRLFVSSYTSLHGVFSRLYDKVDGERGKYHAMCTIHSCRKFFRTHAARTMHPDLVTNLMRQTGYLDNTYVRIPDEQKRKEFHEGERALYITRAIDREAAKNTDKLSALERENKELVERLAVIEQGQTEQAKREKLDLSEMIRNEVERLMLEKK